uniref:Uncharacterized protein n=1 Tax=Arundo donax TaxID=35708 RepID=A0A0A9FRR4_ARUDO
MGPSRASAWASSTSPAVSLTSLAAAARVYMSNFLAKGWKFCVSLVVCLLSALLRLSATGDSCSGC